MYYLPNPNISNMKPEINTHKFYHPPPPPPYYKKRRSSSIFKRLAFCLFLLTSLTSNIIAQTTHTLSVSLSSNSIKEGDAGTKEVIVNFTIDPPRASVFPIQYCVRGTATRGSTEDYSYTFSNDTEVEFNTGTNRNCRNSGVPGSSFTHKIIINGDTDPEPNETVTIELNQLVVRSNPSESTPSDVIISSTAGSVTFTIEDDDPTIVSLTRSGSTGAVNEGEMVEFTVILSRSLIAGEIIDVPLSIGGTGVTNADWNLATKSGTGLNTGVTLSGADTTTPQVRFSSAGADTATLVLTTVVDAVIDTETFTIALGPDGDVTNGFDRTSLGTNVGGGVAPDADSKSFNVQVNNVPFPEITITGGASVTEGTAAAFTVSASLVPAFNLSVNLSVVDALHADFVSSTNQGSGKSVTITAGQATANFTVPTIGGDSETTDEPSSNVTVTVDTGTGYTVGSDSIATVKVTDNDPTTVVLTTPDATATEGSSDNLATLRLTLGRALRSGERLQVPLIFNGGTLDTDFTLSLSGSSVGVTLSDSTVTFSGGGGSSNAAAASATIAEVLLSASEDADTADETVTVSIPSGTAFTPRLTATGLDGGATGSRTGDGQITLINNTPEKPVNFTAIAGDRQVTLNWTDPNNSNITGWQYQQKVSTGDYGNWTTIPGSTAATVSYTVTGLINGTAYTFRIRAVAGTTNGIASDEATTTPRANSVPTVTNMIPDQTATVGTAFNYQFPANTFSDADGDPLSYHATQGDDTALPSWLGFDANSRIFSGIPQASDAGTLSVKVTADDGNGGSVFNRFEITIREAVLGIPAEESFSIYPNPTSGYFKLAGAPKGLNGIILVSTSGRQVRHYPIALDGRYDISGLDEGIFFVFVEGDEGGKQAGRLLIKR